jgi:uncharacterized membrane protein YbjE (DUF340 family)
MTHHHPSSAPQDSSSSWRVALSATIHCLTGCAIGEVLGMVIGSVLEWSSAATVVLSIVLAFFFGYALTLRPLVSAGVVLRRAISLALSADTISITIMEIVDNALMLAVPGAMDAPITSSFFWSSLALSLVVAGIAAFPVNAWLIKRGRGHAHVHAHHDGMHHLR